MMAIAGLFVWACMPIFTEYATWWYDESKDYSSSDYCAYVPFMFAFIMLIVYGIVVGVIAICLLCFCCLVWYAACCEDDDANPPTEGDENTTTTGPAGAVSYNYTYTDPHTLPPAPPQDYDPSVIISIQPLSPAPPIQDFLAPEDLPPPSYDEAIIQS